MGDVLVFQHKLQLRVIKLERERSRWGKLSPDKEKELKRLQHVVKRIEKMKHE